MKADMPISNRMESAALRAHGRALRGTGPHVEVAERDATFGEIVGGQLERYAVTS